MSENIGQAARLNPAVAGMARSGIRDIMDAAWGRPGVIRLEVGGARVPLSLVSAERNLERLPEGHFLRQKVQDPLALAELAAKEPAESVHRLLQSFGRPLTVAEVREHFSGIVPEERWTSFWTSARRHPQSARPSREPRPLW